MPSQAAGVRMGGSVSVKPWSSKKSRAASDDLGANAQDRALAGRANPEMAMLHQEVDAVLLERDRIRIVFRDLLHDLNVGDVEFEAAGRALIGANLAAHDHARLLRQGL